MRLKDWKESKSLVKWWRAVLATPEGKAFLEMLEESHVRHEQRPYMKEGVELGQIQGYDICINNIKAAADSGDQPSDPGDPTYEPPEELAPPRRARKQL